MDAVTDERVKMFRRATQRLLALAGENVIGREPSALVGTSDTGVDPNY